MRPERVDGKPIKPRSMSAFSLLLANYSIPCVFALAVVVMSILSPHFLSFSNLINIALQSSVIGVIAVGMTFVILVRGIDLSVGSLVALSSALGVWSMLFAKVPAWLGMLIIVGSGAIVGVLHGLVVAWLHLPAFIVTLASMQICRGLALALSQGRAWYVLPPLLERLGSSRVLMIPVPVWVMVILFFLAHVILTRTQFGQHVYALGGNPGAARVCGVDVKMVTLASFSICGLLTGLSSLLLTARLTSFYPGVGSGMELDVVAAVVIGGTSLYGGEGWVGGTLLGVLIMGVINNALNLLGVSPFWVSAAKGAIILLAVLMDGLRIRVAEGA